MGASNSIRPHTDLLAHGRDERILGHPYLSAARIGKTAWRDAREPHACYFLPRKFCSLWFRSSSAFLRSNLKDRRQSAPAPIGPESGDVRLRRGARADRTRSPFRAGNACLPVVLENGISTRSAKAGDSLYFSYFVSHHAEQSRDCSGWFPIFAASLLESKRPGRIKGTRRISHEVEHFDFFRTAYTVDLNAAARAVADSGGKENDGFRR